MKIKYSNNICAFDIETTTTEHITDVYLGTFKVIPFDLDITKDKIITARLKVCRSWYDIDENLKTLNAIYKRRREVLIIYIHNLSYEADGLIKNCSFVRENFKPEECLYQKTRKPLFIRLQNIELRCSYILTRKSLKNLGIRYDFPKLEIDYRSRYYSFSKLPEIEYEYNRRDVDLTLWAVINTCKAYPYIKSVEDIPLTATALVRMMNKYINTSADSKYYVKRNEYQRHIPIDTILWYENIYTGGYVHTSADYAFKTLRDVCSIDIKSSYPDVMLHRLYPYYFKEAKYRLKEFFELISNTNDITLEDYFNNTMRPFERAYMARIEIRNIVAKKHNNIEVPYISVSKIVNEPEACIVDNGRLVATRSNVIIDITEVDYWLLKQFYIFELVDVYRLQYTTGFRPLSPYVLNSVRYFLHIKSELKEVVKRLEREDYIISPAEVEHTYTEEELEIINGLDYNNRLMFIKNELAVSKENLNSEYGVNVQKLYPDNIIYNPEEDDFTIEKSNKLSRSLYRNFVEGLYITAYARLTLFSMFLFLCGEDEKIHPIYSDTDSWKIYHEDGNTDRIKELVEEYNRRIEKSCNNSEDYKVGYFDFEGISDFFLSWGCKKYITADAGKIKPTIAGVPKKEFANTLNGLAELYNNDLEYIFSSLEKCNIILPYESTGKLSSRYFKNEEFTLEVEDENGERGVITGVNMVELFDTDYTLIDKRAKANYNYIRYIEAVQHRKIDDSILLVSKEGLKWLSNFPERG